MRVDAFPNCCGAYVINGFPLFYDETQSEKAKQYNDNLRTRTKTEIENFCKQYSLYAFLLAILTPEQEKGNMELLEAAGFVPVGQGINGVHNSFNTLFIRVRPKSTNKTVTREVTPATKIVKSRKKGLRDYEKAAAE